MTTAAADAAAHTRQLLVLSARCTGDFRMTYVCRSLPEPGHAPPRALLLDSVSTPRRWLFAPTPGSADTLQALQRRIGACGLRVNAAHAHVLDVDCDAASTRLFLAHGAPLGAPLQCESYALPPPWRLPVGVRLPCVAEFDTSTRQFRWDRCSGAYTGALRCALLSVYGERVAVFAEWDSQSDARDPRTLVVIAPESAGVPLWQHVWESTVSARGGADVLFVDTSSDAQRMLTEWESHYGSAAVWQLFGGGVCDPDAFLLDANLNRAADGSPVWYRAPFVLHSHWALYAPGTLHALARQLARHRVAWIAEHRLLDYALQLAALTGLSLHDTLRPRQSQLADAIIEATWIDNAERLPPPRLASSAAAADAPTTGDGKHFKGGAVIDAELGLYEGCVLQFDVRSMYPSVARQLGDAVMHELFSSLIAMRRRESNSVRAQALKYLANVTFGTRVHGAYRDVSLGERIAAAGRAVLESGVERVRAALLCERTVRARVLSGDTDSLFVALEPCNGHPVSVEQARRELLALLNSEQAEGVEFACVADVDWLFQLNKKCYVAHERNASDEQLTTRGTDDRVSETTPFAVMVHREYHRALYRRSILDAERHAACVQYARAALYRVQLPGAELVCWPKPTRTHRSITRALYMCVGGEDVPRSRMLDAAHQCPPIDLQRVARLQLDSPLARYATLLFAARKHDAEESKHTK
jgi:hypothetical protein